MIDRGDLKAAVNAGVLSSEQAVRLEAFLVNRARGDDALETGAGESENLRFLSNFNDIFITIGLLILFGGVATLFSLVIVASVEALGSPSMAGLLMAFGIGALAWLMMEYFCARRRMLLPSMFLALVTSICGGMILVAIFSFSLDITDISSPFEAIDSSMAAGLSFFAGATLTAFAIFKRFGLPFSLFIAAVSIAAILYIWLLRDSEIGALYGGLAMFLTGLGTLAVALMFDMRDPERVTRSSDHAFWLHLAAAPQVIYGVGGLITGFIGSEASGAEAIILLIVLVIIGILSLAINRRALIAASLITFIATLSQVFSESGVNGLTTFITVSMIIGGGVVFIGAGWKTARKLVLKFFPTSGIWGRLFPPEIA